MRKETGIEKGNEGKKKEISNQSEEEMKMQNDNVGKSEDQQTDRQTDRQTSTGENGE